jgi:selenocysteine lyase/cysteine desulfurase
VGALGCDVLACSAYKWFGPHVGIQVARPEVLEALRPDKLAPSPDAIPDRFELGTLPFEALVGVTAAARYLASVGWEAIHAHEDALLRRALDGLRAIDGVTLHGDATDRAPTLMFTVDGLTSAEVATRLAEARIAVWDGNYYAYELERHLGLAPDGAVRAGFVHYNVPEEADRLVAAVAEIAAR